MTVSQILRRAIVCLAVSVGLVWGGLRLTEYIASRTMTRAARPKVATSKDILAHSLGGTLWVDSAKVYEDQQIRADLNLENHTGKTVTLQSVEIQTQGFEQSGGCWQPPNRPACVGDGDSAGVVPATLSAGESLRLHATLKPQSAGQRGLLAIYRWSESAADGKKTTETFTRGVNLEPIEVTTRWEEFGAGFASYADKLALPLVLALGGALWGWWNKRRDDRLQASEKERERAFEVWKEQVARVFEYTQQHYLHISRSILGIQTAATKAATATVGAAAAVYRERILFHLVMLWIHLRDLRERRGGWFFSDKDGEEALFAGWVLAANRIDAKLDAKRLDQLADAIKKPVSLAKFRGYFLTTHPLHATFLAAEKQCLEWYDGAAPYSDAGDSFKRCMAVLNAMRMVMRFEWDRPFVASWYGRKPEMKLAEFRGLLTNLPVMAPADTEGTKARAAFEAKARIYAASVEEYLRRG
jgi:hypothetical protein